MELIELYYMDIFREILIKIMILLISDFQT